MGDVVDISRRSLIGKHVKVCRHGECLWLEVKSTRPNGNLVAAVDNHPVAWPERIGDAVELQPDEIVRVYGDE